MSSSWLPIVDLSTPDHAALLQSIDAACSDLGFFMLTGHGIADAEIDRTYQSGLAFFDLPLEEKLAVARPAPDVSRGYNRLADQSHAATFGEKPVADLQESFGLGPLDGRTRAKAAEAATAFAANLWPRRPAEFRPAMEYYYRQMERLALALMRLFAQTLKLSPGFFDRDFIRHASILRLVHYPAQPAAPAPGQLRAGPHTDFGTLTILRIDDAAGGLQVRDRAGDWVDIKAQPGSFIVNIGDLMQRWTGDRWTSSIHRVVNPPREQGAASRRLSLVFFHEPDPDALVCSLPIDGQRSAYPDIVAAAHRLSRVRVLRGLAEKR